MKLRLRADTRIGVAVSGGLDSALLLGLVRQEAGAADVRDLLTFGTDDARYDERPEAQRLARLGTEQWHDCGLSVAQVPRLLQQLAIAEDEPFGGLPSVAYSELFATAAACGVRVVLDGQGMDEQWAGYDYYAGATASPAYQGTRAPATRADLLQASFFDARLHQADEFPAWTGEPLVDVRLRDVLHTKLPRALRFNDRLSMMHSCELREPFLDHVLVELALSQPARRLINGKTRKVLLREIAAPWVPAPWRDSPKRAVQTPQREWLSGELAPWVRRTIEASTLYREWYRQGAVDVAISDLQSGRSDHSLALWQMLSLALWER